MTTKTQTEDGTVDKDGEFFLEESHDFDLVTEDNDNNSISAEYMPDFNESELPFVKIKHLHIQDYKIFHNYKIDFTYNGEVNNFASFIGPNGSGKSTTLEIVQTLFANYDAYDKKRLNRLLGKSVRHVDGDDQSGIYGSSTFKITADLSSSYGDYTVSLTKDGFGDDHPERIKNLAMRLCYYARFDQELRQFQLDREKWPLFKELFESVTGFKIAEQETEFAIGNSKVSKDFVFGFYVQKPNETIHYKECSDGERKIMKSFSSLLNLEYTPSIILIDNVEMHVESGRHLPLIKCMKKCFGDSQIVTTTHSYHISRNFANKNQIHDLRLLNCKEIFKQEPWRLQLQDEIKDSLVKLQSISKSHLQLSASCVANMGRTILDSLGEPIESKDNFRVLVQTYTKMVSDIFIDDLI